MNGPSENRPDIILNIDKPVGWSSNDVIRYVRRVFPGTKAGHAGTLDPFATGVLLVCVGKATKRVNELMDLDKEYIAEIRLGMETDTLDVSGKVTSRGQLPELSPELLLKAENRFTGIIEQTPPAYSAVKVQGQRAYEMARQGKEVKLKKRKVSISKLSLTQTAPDRIIMHTVCSKGTYIRTLAQDICFFWGTFGYVQKLIRQRIGEYTLQSSLSINHLYNKTSV